MKQPTSPISRIGCERIHRAGKGTVDIARYVVRRPGVHVVGFFSNLLESARRAPGSSAHLPSHRVVGRGACDAGRAVAGLARVVAGGSIAARARHLHSGRRGDCPQLADVRLGREHQPDRADQPRIFHQPAAQRGAGPPGLSRTAAEAAVGVDCACRRRRVVPDGCAGRGSLDRAVPRHIVRNLWRDEEDGAPGPCARAGAGNGHPLRPRGGVSDLGGARRARRACSTRVSCAT